MSLQLTTNLLTFLEESKIAADGGEWACSVVLPHKSNTVLYRYQALYILYYSTEYLVYLHIS